MSMADSAQKTQKPTPKRLRDFRKRGDIALSKDVMAVATLLGGAVALIAFADDAGRAIADLLSVCVRKVDGSDASELPAAAAHTFVVCVIPPCVGAMLALLVSGTLQLGWPPALKSIKFDVVKIVTFQSAAQILSPKAALGRGANSLAKVGLVGVAMFIAARGEMMRFLEKPAVEPRMLAERLSEAALRLGLYSLVALTGLAAFDYLWKRRSVNNKMMMSSEEIKKEHKESEGDPHVKGARRRKMRQLAQRRLAVEVKTADVVIVNPTHYAVALRYQTDKEGAPRVVAKGRGPLAERIREMARKAGVPILPRPPLTRLLYKLVPEGREIPAQVYQAVAEVLAFVYKVRRGVRRSS